jgi:hypothetical protein
LKFKEKRFNIISNILFDQDRLTRGVVRHILGVRREEEHSNSGVPDGGREGR